jgi:hypothetical protein
MIQSASPLSALVLSTDTHASTTSVSMLESHGFAVSKTDNSVRARELCRRKRFDLAVYDQDSSHELNAAGSSTLFGTPHVVLGLVGANGTGQALGKRIHFVVQKPFTGDLFRKTLKAAYGAIALGRRLSSRHEVCIDSTSPCLIHRGERRTLKTATIMNISQQWNVRANRRDAAAGSEPRIEFFNSRPWSDCGSDWDGYLGPRLWTRRPQIGWTQS